MSCILNARERKALAHISFDHNDFIIKGKLPAGIGQKTLEGLVTLGLLEKGPSQRYYGQTGYKVTPDGWRCMYGQTYEEIMAPPERTVHPLRVWRWPPANPERGMTGG